MLFHHDLLPERGRYIKVVVIDASQDAGVV
jgi:hypothetical protein